jgi:ribosomal protein S20
MSRMKGAMKNLMATIKTGDKAKATALLTTICKIIDKAAQGHVIHKNNAARHKSQATRAVAAMK